MAETGIPGVPGRLPRLPGTPPSAVPTGALRRPMRGLQIASSGLSAQRARIDVVAQNIANAETTRGADGTPYRRQVVQLQEVPFNPLLASRLDGAPIPDPEGGVQVAGIGEDVSEGALVYDPGHPDADANGYVRMPNVDLNVEMVDLLDARRHFEANATVFQAIKAMLRRSTQL